MSSHRRKTIYFSRKFNARKALLRGLMDSLVEHERISTTVDRAKEVRRHIEKAITLGKKDDLGARRLLLSRIANVPTVEKILKTLSPRFKERPGGYTRIIKIGRRPGDTAEMAFLEFVDYDFKKAAALKKKSPVKAGGKVDADTKKALKEQAKHKKAVHKLVAAHKKSVRQMRAKSRAMNRA